MRLSSQSMKSEPIQADTRPRRIVFLISSFRGVNTGVGGHYRSVKEISALLSDIAEVQVVTFGDVPSPVFEGHQAYTHIQAWSCFSLSGIIRFRRFLREFSGDMGGRTVVISVGWIISYVVAALASVGSNLTRLHVRPGGEAPQHPRIFNGVCMGLFHQKDVDLFQSLDPRRTLALVPGRVTPPAFDPAFVRSSNRPFDTDARLKILCIMRIASDKRRPSRLIYEALEQAGGGAPPLPVTFTHCGTIQDESLYAELATRKLGIESAFVTDSLTTGSAPKYLYGHDAFVGIGRSVIEAMSVGIPAFIPVIKARSEIKLCAVTANNWQQFLRENFTHRTTYSALEECGEVICLEDFARNRDLQKRLTEEVRKIYDENLSPAASLQTWRELLSEEHSSPSVAGDIGRAIYALYPEFKRMLSLGLRLRH